MFPPEKIKPHPDLNLTKKVISVIFEAKIPLVPAALANLPPPKMKYSRLLTQVKTGILNNARDDPNTKDGGFFDLVLHFLNISDLLL